MWRLFQVCYWLEIFMDVQASFKMAKRKVKCTCNNKKLSHFEFFLGGTFSQIPNFRVPLVKHHITVNLYSSGSSRHWWMGKEKPKLSWLS